MDNSFLATLGFHFAVWIVLIWTILVTLFMVVYATLTREAALGMLIMVFASMGTLCASFLTLLGHIPTEMLIVGPFVFQSSKESGGHIRRTMLQLGFFWATFLLLIPLAIIYLEDHWRLVVFFPLLLRIIGLVLFGVASYLGVWSAITMAHQGKGTPLPSDMPRHLVVSGPYKYVRNPMAVAGIAQGASVGLITSSWLVVLYALIGSLLWNWAVRPHEEEDLHLRFGVEYDEYKRNVDCWVPRIIQQALVSNSVGIDKAV